MRILNVALSALIILLSIGMGTAFGALLMGSGAVEALPSLPHFSLLPAPFISPTPLPTPAPAPQTLVINKLALSAAVESVGLDADQKMDVPKDVNNVAWYHHGPKPGEKGNAVLAGHLDGRDGPAVFYRLNELMPGDELSIIDEVQGTHVFRVTRLATYPVDAFPLSEVFGPYHKPRLNLITCEGTYDRANKNYSHRVVVYTEKITE